MYLLKKEFVRVFLNNRRWPQVNLLPPEKQEFSRLYIYHI